MGDPTPCLYILLGPTAAGKTDVAARLAEALGAEIISADSMKVYRGLDIGTAKPAGELRERFGYHLIDIREPHECYDAKQFTDDCAAAVRAAHARGHEVLIEGGSALYLKCFTEGIFPGPPADSAVRAELEALAETLGPRALHKQLAAADPQTAARLHPNDLKRVIRALEVCRLTGTPISQLQRQFGRRRGDFRFRLAGLRWARQTLRERIDRRVDAMLAAGLLDEVERLCERASASAPRMGRGMGRGMGLGRTASQALGYRELARHLAGEVALPAAVSAIKQNTWHFARRQMQWFRRFADVQWVDCAAPPAPADVASEILRRWGV